MLEAALAYARMHWRVFPLHTIVNGACSCGKACNSPAKHPRNKRGFKDATDDVLQIQRWWERYPDSNIGIATGSGLVVIDIDGQEGENEFKALAATHGMPPETLVAKTGNGYHAFYLTRPDSPEVRSSARGAVHVRGEGGYVVGVPSRHYSGQTYKWVRNGPIATLPEWLRKWSQGYDISDTAARREGFNHLGSVPNYLSGQNQIDVGRSLENALKPKWSASEQARLISALAAIHANSHDSWVAVGMALKDLEWQRSDGTDAGFDIWVAWSETCPEKFALGVCEARWNSFKRTGVTLGTVYHMAQQAGWSGGVPPPALNGTPNHQALPAAFLAGPQAIFFPDLTEDGKPRPTMTNAAVAITGLGIQCRKDLFHEKTLVAGEPINQWVGDLSDDIVQMIRKIIRYRFGFDPNKNNTVDACVQLSLEHQFDPVLDYLDSLQWDGTARLETWLARYMGAADTELNRAIGRLTLVAAVRRAYSPGTKFDQIIVLEGPEGRGKSTAIEILAGRDNFSDQKILGLHDREQQEAMAGIWLYEIADLTGMRKAEIEHVKAFASRTVDRARPVYGRFRVDRPRRTIFFATTNSDDYLRSETGNRRFWPIQTGRIDLAGLRQDRDQLWAEASQREAQGISAQLDARLWQHAAAQQEGRLESDPWFDLIRDYVEMPGKERVDVSIVDVLLGNQFIQLSAERLGQREQNRAAAILRRLSFVKYRKREGQGLAWRYRRLSP